MLHQELKYINSFVLEQVFELEEPRPLHFCPPLGSDSLALAEVHG